MNKKKINIIYPILSGNPEPKVAWKKNGKEIKPKQKDKRFIISWDIDNDLNTLEIKEATVEDAGAYTIEATNSLGTVEATVTVTVEPTKEPEEEEPVNEAVCVEETTIQETVAEHDDKEEESTEISVVPEIMIKPEDITVTPGESVKLSCKIKGILPYLECLAWIINVCLYYY